MKKLLVITLIVSLSLAGCNTRVVGNNDVPTEISYEIDVEQGEIEKVLNIEQSYYTPTEEDIKLNNEIISYLKNSIDSKDRVFDNWVKLLNFKDKNIYDLFSGLNRVDLFVSGVGTYYDKLENKEYLNISIYAESSIKDEELVKQLIIKATKSYDQRMSESLSLTDAKVYDISDNSTLCIPYSEDGMVDYSRAFIRTECYLLVNTNSIDLINLNNNDLSMVAFRNSIYDFKVEDIVTLYDIHENTDNIDISYFITKGFELPIENVISVKQQIADSRGFTGTLQDLNIDTNDYIDKSLSRLIIDYRGFNSYSERSIYVYVPNGNYVIDFPMRVRIEYSEADILKKITSGTPTIVYHDGVTFNEYLLNNGYKLYIPYSKCTIKPFIQRNVAIRVYDENNIFHYQTISQSEDEVIYDLNELRLRISEIEDSKSLQRMIDNKSYQEQQRMLLPIMNLKE